MSALIQDKTWTEILDNLERRLNHQSFDTWIRPILFDDYDSNTQTLSLRAPNQVVRDWVCSNYLDVIDATLQELKIFDYKIHWTIEEESFSSLKTIANQKAKDEDVFGSHGVTKLILDNRTSDLISILERTEPKNITGATTFVDIEPLEHSLNPKCSFNTFVVGSCNQFAHAAALAVAEAPGKTYNPLYIYGGVGLGKTHLMHACGQAIEKRNPHLKLCYLSSEKFMNELINAIRYDKTQGFREKYRSVDVLLIDDVQFIAGKERTQEEFFHTFNSLYDQQKQIVISSDCPPREIPTLEERLHSRFEWGLIADIEPPDLETKVAIINRKAEIMGVTIPDDVALLIATRVKNNVRELEGSLVRLIAISSLRGDKISKVLAQDAVRNIAGEEESGVITIQQIQKVVANNFKMRVDELISKSNARQFSRPRQIAMYLCKKLTKHSYPEIGRAFGGKHHTTVIHSFAKIESLKSRDSSLQKLVNELSERLER